MRLLSIALLPVLALAGCAAESRLAPVSTAGTAGGPSNTEPEPSNSLPRGSAVNRPLTGDVGNIGTTRVGPAVTSAPTPACTGVARPGRAY